MALQSQLGPSEISRLKDLVFEGVRTYEEIEALKAGISDTVIAVAEELQLSAKLLKRVISTAHKGNYADLESELGEVETLLKAIGRK